MIRLVDAIAKKEYRIYNISGLLYAEEQNLKKKGFINESKLIFIEKTSYDFYLVEVTHPNGEIIKHGVREAIAKCIFLEDYSLDASYIVINIDE